MSVARVNFAIDPALLRKVDDGAAEMHVSRSAYICYALSEKIQRDTAMKDLPAMLESLKAISNNEVVIAQARLQGMIDDKRDANE